MFNSIKIKKAMKKEQIKIKKVISNYLTELNEETIKTMFYYFKGYPKTSYIDLYNLVDETIADCIYDNNLTDYVEVLVKQLYYSNKLSKIK